MTKLIPRTSIFPYSPKASVLPALGIVYVECSLKAAAGAFQLEVACIGISSYRQTGSTLANKAVAEGVKLASALSSRLTFLTVFVPFASLADHDHALLACPRPSGAQHWRIWRLKAGRHLLRRHPSLSRRA